MKRHRWQQSNDTSTPSGIWVATDEQTVAVIGYSRDTDEKGLLEYPLAKKEDPADSANSRRRVFYKSNANNQENCLELSPFLQKPTYIVLISIKHNTRMPRTVEALGNALRLNLMNSSLLLANWRSYDKILKAPPLKIFIKQSIPVQGHILLHECIGALPAHSWFIIIENLAVNLLLKMSLLTGVSLPSSQPDRRPGR